MSADANGREPGQGLTRGSIAATALRLIDRDGLESFSLRSLAKELGVYPSAIYWHLPNRNAILAEVVALVIADVMPPSGLEWRAHISALMHQFRAALYAHPRAVPLLGAQLVANTATNLDLVESILASLSQAGFSGPRLVAAYNAVCAAMVGFAVEELCAMPDDRAEWQRTVQERLGDVNMERYPVLSRNLAGLSDRAFMLRWSNGISAPLDSGFELFTAAFITGLAALAYDGPR